MAHKNSDKCDEILKYAYFLFSQKDYRSVFLKDIAEHVGISKSQLQNLYPKKSEIMRELLSEYLSYCFEYIEKQLSPNTNLYFKLALFTSFFWKVVESNKGLNTFMMNIITDYELRMLLIDCVFQWHHEMKYTGDDISESVNLKPALIFAISGGVELYVQKDQLNVKTQYITMNIAETFMRMMGCGDDQIDDVIAYTKERLPIMDIDLFLDDCCKNIMWIQL